MLGCNTDIKYMNKENDAATKLIISGCTSMGYELCTLLFKENSSSIVLTDYPLSFEVKSVVKELFLTHCL